MGNKMKVGVSGDEAWWQSPSLVWVQSSVMKIYKIYGRSTLLLLRLKKKQNPDAWHNTNEY